MKKFIVLGVLCLLPAMALADEYVRGYTRKDGTYVEPYRRSSPDSRLDNNYGFPGNYNPNSGRQSQGSPDAYRRNHDNNSNPFGGSNQNRYQPFGK